MAKVDQQGSQNKTNLFQTGEGSNPAIIGQYGAYNQVGGPHERYFALQNGSANQISITQSAVDATVTLNNSANLSQIGTLNSLSLNQSILAGADAGDTATIFQDGTMNAASVTQVSGTAP